jgi:hypothetical protein
MPAFHSRVSTHVRDLGGCQRRLASRHNLTLTLREVVTQITLTKP